MSKTYPRLERMSLSEIHGANYNPRKITPEALGRLAKSIAELGDLQPITINARTGNRIIGGHQRYDIYCAMGRKEVDVWVVDLPEEKEKIANLALNNLAGEFDTQALKDLIEQIDTTDIDLELTGFSQEELDRMMSEAPPELPKDEEKEEDMQMIPIYIPNEEFSEFTSKLKKIGDSIGVEGTADVIRHCVQKTYGSLKD